MTRLPGSTITRRPSGLDPLLAGLLHLLEAGCCRGPGTFLSAAAPAGPEAVLLGPDLSVPAPRLARDPWGPAALLCQRAATAGPEGPAWAAPSWRPASRRGPSSFRRAARSPCASGARSSCRPEAGRVGAAAPSAPSFRTGRPLVVRSENALAGRRRARRRRGIQHLGRRTFVRKGLPLAPAAAPSGAPVPCAWPSPARSEGRRLCEHQRIGSLGRLGVGNANDCDGQSESTKQALMRGACHRLFPEGYARQT